MAGNSEWRAFLETLPQGFYALDTQGRITDANRHGYASLGYTLAELLRKGIADLTPDFDPAAPRSHAQIKPVLPPTWRLRHKNGHLLAVEAHLEARADPGAGYFLLTQEPAVAPAQQRLRRLTRLYQALSEINQAIVRMQDEAALFPLVCQVAVELGGMKMAWVGGPGADGRRLEPATAYGSKTAYLADIEIPLGSATPGPAATAWQQARNVIINDFQTSAMTRPWHEAAARYGWHSAGFFPIARRGRPFAVLGVYHEQADAFDEEAVALLDEMARDITFALDNFDREKERRQALAALSASEEKLSKIFHNSPSAISITRLGDGTVIDVNEAWTRLTGYAREDVIGHSTLEFNIWIRPEDRLDFVAKLAAQGRLSNMEMHFRAASGPKPFLVSAEVMQFGEAACVVLMAQDLSTLKEALATIDEQRKFLESILESEPDCVKVVAPDGTLLQMNRAGLAMLEVEDIEQARAVGLMNFIEPGHRKTFAEFHRNVCAGGSGTLEFLVRGRLGTERWLETHATPLRGTDGGITALLGITRDITAKKRAEELIWRQANFDLLTGLPNRFMFHERLEQEIRNARRSGKTLALIFLDLDDFKGINDTRGHAVGDRVLVEAAQRIAACVRASDTVARLGGDEFTVLLPQLYDSTSAEQIAAAIIARLKEPFVPEGGHGAVFLSASAGITLHPDDGDDAETLLRNADQAMYAAKARGRNRYSYFTPALQAQAQARQELLGDLRRALAEGQFILYFQPIVELASTRLVKAEALLRWAHPVRGLVSAGEFIPLAEETGLIQPLGEWVFREATRWASHWAGLHAPGFQIGVNISPAQLHNDALNIDAWLAAIAEAGLAGASLVAEITESVLLDPDPEVAGKLSRLRSAGVQMAIDDFGTGYSALSYLKHFAVDYLKIDQTFVHDLATDAHDRALTEAIIAMAHRLGLKVIAEGVETEAQRSLLVAAGCDYGQGYLFARPLPAEEFEALLMGQ